MKNKQVKIFNKPFITAIGAILAIFIFLNIFINNMIEDHFYSHIEREAKNLALGYTQSMSKSIMADEIINNLLREKLLAASQTALMYADINSNQDAINLSNTLRVDEVNLYTNDGSLEYSTDPSFVGWQAYQGHPIYDFINNDNNTLIEEIRANVITGEFYKYGYFKADGGDIVQIGINAEKINSFLKEFNMNSLFSHLYEDEKVLSISFLDNSYNYIESTNKDLISTELSEQTVKKIGTLVISQSLKETNAFIQRFTTIGFLAVALICFLIFYGFLSIQKKNASLYKMAYYDPLTGLPNSQYLIENYPLTNNKGKFLLLVNLSNFRILNMTYGYNYGDLVLIEMSNRLNQLKNDHITPARLNADIFIILARNIKEDKLEVFLNKLTKTLEKPFFINQTKKHIESKIGIYKIEEAHSFDNAIKNALIAMNYTNTESNKNFTYNFTYFDDKMEVDLKREELIESEIRGFLEGNNECITLSYQPQLNIKTDKVIGVEALARMNSKHFGQVSPLEFIPIAERTNLIIPLGVKLFELAAKFVKKMESLGIEIKTAINISGIQVLDDEFSDTIFNIINKNKINPKNVELEITESILLDNFNLINNRLKEFKDKKIDVALDDFGTGYSSFFRLRELNVNSLKIDKSFIENINNKDKKELITGEIITMAHKFDLKVIAEGVENKEELNYLKENDCDIIQGYIFSKAIKEDEVIRLVSRHNGV